MHPGLTSKLAIARIDDMHREAAERRVTDLLRHQARSPFRRRVSKPLFTRWLTERPVA